MKSTKLVQLNKNNKSYGSNSKFQSTTEAIVYSIEDAKALKDRKKAAQGILAHAEQLSW